MYMYKMALIASHPLERNKRWVFASFGWRRPDTLEGAVVVKMLMYILPPPSLGLQLFLRVSEQIFLLTFTKC